MIIIPEGSKVSFKLHGYGNPYIIKKCEANSDIQLYPNSIVMIDGGLYSMSLTLPLDINSEGEYIVDLYVQDAYCVKENMFYQSTSDVG